MVSEGTFEKLFRAATRRACHLEMRDAYMVDDPAFIAWKAGEPIEDDDESQWWRQLVAEAVERGVAVQRARIVSEPLSDYTRFEFDLTEGHNIAAGEQVRWLPRRKTTDIPLPGNDYWLMDDAVVLVNHFAGDGTWLDTEEVTDPGVVQLCRFAFEAVWQRATPHDAYQPD